MSKKLILVFSLILIVVVLFGCTQGGYNTTNSNTQTTPQNNNIQDQNTAVTTSEPQNYPINISNFSFNPQEVKIKVGDSVSWLNNDSMQHKVASVSGNEISSELLPKGASYKHTFNTPGTYTYYCTIHTSMRGTIIVE